MALGDRMSSGILRDGAIAYAGAVGFCFLRTRFSPEGRGRFIPDELVTSLILHLFQVIVRLGEERVTSASSLLNRVFRYGVIAFGRALVILYSILLWRFYGLGVLIGTYLSGRLSVNLWTALNWENLTFVSRELNKYREVAAIQGAAYILIRILPDPIPHQENLNKKCANLALKILPPFIGAYALGQSYPEYAISTLNLFGLYYATVSLYALPLL